MMLVFRAFWTHSHWLSVCEVFNDIFFHCGFQWWLKSLKRNSFDREICVGNMIATQCTNLKLRDEPLAPTAINPQPQRLFFFLHLYLSRCDKLTESKKRCAILALYCYYRVCVGRISNSCANISQFFSNTCFDYTMLEWKWYTIGMQRNVDAASRLQWKLRYSRWHLINDTCCNDQSYAFA